MRIHALLSPALAALISCGGAQSSEAGKSARRKASEKPAGQRSGPPALRALEIARVPEGTFGPYVGSSRDGALLVWAPALDGKRAWHTLPVNPDGTPLGEARRVADAPSEIGLVAVKGAPDAPELIIVSTRRTGLGEVVEATLVGANGELLAATRPLAELPTQALWVEASAASERWLVLWATKGAEHADIRGIALGAKAEPKGDPLALANGVRAWQAVPFAGGTALGVLRPKADRAPGGSVEVLLLDAEGRSRMNPVVVSSIGRPELDFDLAVLGNSLVVAWSDARDGETRVYRALVDRDGKISASESPLTAALGEQALVRLLARKGSPRAWAIWESPGERAGGVQAFDIASVGPDGRVGNERGRLLLESDAGTVPELAAVGDGVAALTLAPACRRNVDCAEADVLPTFVRFGPSLEVVASEPLRLEPLHGGPAELGWGLSCGDSACFSLAALGKAPAPVFVTRLERRSDDFVPAGLRLGREERPRLRENRVLARSEPLAAVALARGPTGSLAGYLTDFDPTTPWVKLKKPAPDGRLEPLRGRLSLLGLGAEGAPLGPARDLSLRAHSLGGIALVAPATQGGDILAGWTGVDAGQPQVFVTLVGPDGSRRAQRMLTRKTGDASDVAAAALTDGWLVVWIDERDLDPELYASKVDAKLARPPIERRLTNALGPATEPSVVSAGDAALVVWADARQAERPGEADIYIARVGARDLAPLGAERVVLATRGHSFAPVLRAAGGGFLLAWLERGTPEAPDGAGLVFQSLDASGAARREPERVALSGDPAALALDCVGDACRVVVALRFSTEAQLLAGVHRVGAPVLLRRLVALGSKGAARVPLGLSGDELVYADADAEGRWRVRRALVDWPGGAE